MNKKLIVLLLCASLAGCGQAKPSGNSSSSAIENTSSSSSQEEQYNIVRPTYNPEYNNYSVSAAPSGVNMTYYSDIYSRGFSWLTDESVTDTKLYLVQSDKGEQADFSSAQAIDGSVGEITYEKNGDFAMTEDANSISYPHKSGDNSSNDYVLKANSHKVHVENLEKGKAYSYKLGSEQGWYYGAFIVEKDAPKELTAVHMSDAQTKDPSKLNVWRNTFTKAVTTAGDKLDTVLYNGDQFDQNISKVNSSDQYKPNRLLSYAKAYDIIQDYKFNLPYMSAAGNHERTAPYSHYIMSDIDYDGYDYAGSYYSYDYNFAHFVVLNTKSVTDDEVTWLQQDLAASNAKWKIVMMHISPYSTGDNSNSSENQNIVKKFTPIFSANHVDLVLQAHDHTYNKTLPYKWDAAGYTTTWNNEEVVNFTPETETKDNIVYDKNPEGTYYVTTGAAGHRSGGAESDGIWADVTKDGDSWKGVNSSKTFLSNNYKIECGKLKYDNHYDAQSGDKYTCTTDYHVGDLATGNVNAQMFGVLNLSETTLNYNVYTVNNDTVKLFDSVDVLKA